jgi:hypothetical protein
MIILNSEPPLVNVILPFLNTKEEMADDTTEFYHLHRITNDDISGRRNPANLGKFLTGDLSLQWQIISNADVWAIDVRFYDSKTINWHDENEDDYLYRTFINDINNLPAVVDLNEALDPFYRIVIPDMSSWSESFDYISRNGRIERLVKPITEKTTMRVVVRCMDASGLELQEREMGLFIYWPDAAYPWIVFPENLKDYYFAPSENPLYELYSLFPTSTIPFTAFANDGVERIEYSVYRVLVNDPVEKELDEDLVYSNTLSGGASSLRVFSWNFSPPVITAEYLLRATVFSVNGKHDTFSGFFEVSDISYPDIDPPITPTVSRPLFHYIKGATIDTWHIDIEGFAYDNVAIGSVSMAWINPKSINYAAMSQLAFFRDPKYGEADMERTDGTTAPAGEYGWFTAPEDPNDVGLDFGFDANYPNLVWNMNPVHTRDNVEREA